MIAHTTPRSYNNAGCYKGYVLEMFEYDDGPNLFVNWFDDVPTTFEACSNLWLGAYLFAEEPTDGSWHTVDLRQARGRWSVSVGGSGGSGGTGGTGRCFPPGTVFNGFTQDRSYRIAVSARTQKTSSAPTRSVQFVWPGP